MPGRPFVRFLLLVLLAASLLRSISEPFVGLHDFNTADHAQFARVILRQPASVHHFLATYALGMERPEEPHHYAHHPPMITWLTAISFWIFGDSEWAARLAPILCSLAGLAILMRLVCELNGERVALMTGLIYAVTPIGAFFGRMANHEAPTLCFSLLAVWGWTGIRAGQSRGVKWHAAYLVGAGCAIYSGWPGTIVAGGIAVDALLLLARSKCGAGRTVMAVAWPAVVLVVLVCHLVYGGMDGHWDAWWDLLTTRSLGIAPAKQGDDPMRTFGEYTVQNFTWPALVLAAGFLLAYILAARRFSPVGTMWILVAAGIGHLCFYRQALMHHYWWFYCWPGVAYFAARGLLLIRDGVRRVSARLADAVAVGGAGAVVVCGLLHTDLYYSYRTYPPNKLAFWTDPALEAIVPAMAPILLGEPMAQREKHGTYMHWWWGEPATAYYMDRPFRLVLTPADLEREAEFSRYLVVSDECLGRLHGLRKRLEGMKPVYAKWGYRVYDVEGLAATRPG